MELCRANRVTVSVAAEQDSPSDPARLGYATLGYALSFLLKKYCLKNALLFEQIPCCSSRFLFKFFFPIEKMGVEEPTRDTSR